MKKVFCLIIALSLVFGAISPVFAVTETQVSAFMNPNGGNSVGAFSAISSIISYLASLTTQLDTFFNLNSSNNQPSTIYKFQDLYNTLAHLDDWLVPIGARGSNNPTMMDSIIVLTNYAMNHLPDISNIAGYVASWMGTNNNYLSQLNLSLSRQTQNANNLETTMHSQLGNPDDAGYNYGWYRAKTIRDLGVTNTTNYQWQKGTPLGNIALLLQHIANSQADIYHYNWVATLTHFSDNLTTWDHSTNTQVSFTPESLTQGLYRYLAYIQSDTSANYYLENLGWKSGLNDTTLTFPFVTTNGDLANINLNSNTYTNFYNRVSQFLRIMDTNLANGFNQQNYRYNASQSYKNWSNLNDVSFTPVSSTNGIYLWLKRIQEPVARLSFVLANDEEIAARNAAKDDQNSVINNFVASTGQATATPSDYAGVSNASASFKQNFNTGVASSGIWDTFSNTHYTWFTQDTANALDTVSASSRGTYDTPLLDNYYHEVLGYFDNNRRNEDTAFDYVGNYIEQFNAERAESESDER